MGGLLNPPKKIAKIVANSVWELLPAIHYVVSELYSNCIKCPVLHCTLKELLQSIALIWIMGMVHLLLLDAFWELTSISTASCYQYFFIVGVLRVVCDNKPQTERINKPPNNNGFLQNIFCPVHWMRRNFCGRWTKFLGWERRLWQRGIRSAEAQFFYFCTVVSLMLYFNKSSVLHATRHFTVY